MTNRARDLLHKHFDEETARFKSQVEEVDGFLKDFEKDFQIAYQPFLKAIQKLGKTGDVDKEALSLELDDIEYIESDQENVGVKKGGRRKKASALTESTTENVKPVTNIKIKKEKISDISVQSTRTSLESTTSSVMEIPSDKIKTENDEMPAPNWIPPKKKVKEIKTERASVRSTRTKGKKPPEPSHVRDSDVMVQNSTITTITLSDTEDSDVEKPQIEETQTRSTRTKTRQQQATAQAVESGTDTDTESTRTTRTKTRNKKEEPTVEVETVLEETRSTRTKTRKVKKEEMKQATEEPLPEVRSTRTKTIKKTKEVEETTDVEPEPVRSTRTKTKKQVEKDAVQPKESDEKVAEGKPRATISKPNAKSKPKRHRSESEGEDVIDNKERKKSKSNSPVHDNQVNTTTQTVYEDAQDNIGPPQDKPMNSTFVTVKSTNELPLDLPPVPPLPPLNSTVILESKGASSPNSTMVVEHPKFNIFDKKSNNDLFTDDDSIEIQPKTPPKKVPIRKASKEVFSPYEKTTLKKKVEAFEKLQSGASEIPVKTGAIAKSIRGTPSSIKDKSKVFTPLGMKFMPSSSSTSKISRYLPSHQQNSTANDSMLGPKSAQKDPRERQMKLLERDQALKKKEALLQAQAEARRKQNEEKQLKAQQQRKALEAEKLKQLELQKQKEERMRQRELEREEYMQKQKLEQEKKRLAHKKKVQEMQAQREKLLAEQAINRPIYMTTEPPQLPTDDCYDSDDPGYKQTKPPFWCSGEVPRLVQLSMLASGEKIKNTLFCRHAQTPDLSEIFEGIDPRKLKRSSSILWRKPPRYTMMPDLNETKFSDDEELYDSD